MWLHRAAEPNNARPTFDGSGYSSVDDLICPLRLQRFSSKKAVCGR